MSDQRSPNPPREKLTTSSYVDMFDMDWTDAGLLGVLNFPLPDAKLATSQSPAEDLNHLLALAVNKKWVELEQEIERNSFTIPALFNTRISTPVYENKHLLAILIRGEKWGLIEAIRKNLAAFDAGTSPPLVDDTFDDGLLLLALRGEFSFVRQLINQDAVTQGPIRYRAMEGLASGCNLLWFLAYWGYWKEISRLVAWNALSSKDLDASPAHGVEQNTSVLDLLAHHKQWQLLTKLLHQKLLRPTQLKDALVQKIIAAKNWQLLETLWRQKLLKGPLSLETLRLLLEMRQYKFFKRFIDSPDIVIDITPPPGRGNPGKALFAKLVKAEKWGFIRQLIERGLFHADFLDKALLRALVEKQQLGIFAEIIQRDLVSLEVMLADDDQVSAGSEREDLIALMMQKRQWRSVLLLAQKKLIATEHLTGKCLSLLVTSTGDDAIRRDILTILVEQQLLKSSDLFIKPDPQKPGVNLLTYIVFDMQRADLVKPLAAEITPQLLLESLSQSGFLYRLLSNAKHMPILEELLAAPLNPLAEVPWAAFKEYTAGAMVHFRDSPVFQQLLAVGVQLPVSRQLAAMLKREQQLLWLHEGGPALTLEKIAELGWELQPIYEEGVAVQSMIARWLWGYHYQPTNEKLIEVAGFSKDAPGGLKLALLRYGGVGAAHLLLQDPPPMSELAPHLSDHCVIDWLCHDVDTFEHYFLYLAESTPASLPAYETIRDLEQLDAVQGHKLQQLYRKWAVPEQLSVSVFSNPATELRKFAPPDQSKYWTRRVEQEISSLISTLAFVVRAGSVEHQALNLQIAAIVLSYLWTGCYAIAEDKRGKSYFTQRYRPIALEAMLTGDENYLRSPALARPSLESSSVLMSTKDAVDSLPALRDAKALSAASGLEKDSVFHALFGRRQGGSGMGPNTRSLRLRLANSVFEMPSFQLYPILIGFIEAGQTIQGRALNEYIRIYTAWKKKLQANELNLKDLLVKNTAVLRLLQKHYVMPIDIGSAAFGFALQQVVTELQEDYPSLKFRRDFMSLLAKDSLLSEAFFAARRSDYPEISDELTEELRYEYALSIIQRRHSFLPCELRLIAELARVSIRLHQSGRSAQLYENNDRSNPLVEIQLDEFAVYSPYLGSRSLELMPLAPATAEPLAKRESKKRRREAGLTDEDDLAVLSALDSSGLPEKAQQFFRAVIADDVPTALGVLLSMPSPCFEIPESLHHWLGKIQYLAGYALYRVVNFLGKHVRYTLFSNVLFNYSIRPLQLAAHGDLLSWLAREQRWWVVACVLPYFRTAPFTYGNFLLLELCKAPLTETVWRVWEALAKVEFPFGRAPTDYPIAPEVLLKLISPQFVASSINLLRYFGVLLPVAEIHQQLFLSSASVKESYRDLVALYMEQHGLVATADLHGTAAEVASAVESNLYDDAGNEPKTDRLKPGTLIHGGISLAGQQGLSFPGFFSPRFGDVRPTRPPAAASSLSHPAPMGLG